MATPNVSDGLRRRALAGSALGFGAVYLYWLVWNEPPLPIWLAIFARVALPVCCILSLRSARRSGLRERINALPEAEKTKLNGIYRRSYFLLFLMFLAIAGLVFGSGLRPYFTASSYRAMVAGLVFTLLVTGGLNYRLRRDEARLFDRANRSAHQP